MRVRSAKQSETVTAGGLAPLLDRTTEEVLEAVRTAGRFSQPIVEANRSATIRLALQFVIGILAQWVILAWLYNSTNASLPIVIIFHAAVNTATRFTLPGFAGSDYQIAWWVRTVLYFLIAILVIVLAAVSG